jgi:Glycosyl transferase family 2
LTVGQNLLSRTFSRATSLVAFFGDSVTRVRYRRADLRRISAVEMVSDHPSPREGFRWLPAVRVRGRAHVALMCSPNSRVIYDVTLPAHATVACWCTLAPENCDRNVGGVEFEIHVRTQGGETSARRLVSPGASWFGRRWHRLHVHIPEAGPARIVLTTRSTDGARAGEVGALWGNPRIEAPRSLNDLWSALRSAISAQNIRGLWHSALPANAARLYRLWVRENEPSRKALSAQRQWSHGRTRSFSLITLVDRPADWSPHRTAASVRRQSYPGWEWILIAPEGSMPEISRAVARIGRDERIRILTVPSGASRADAWNAGLRDARGEFAALLGQHDLLAPAALYEMARALERSPDRDLLYSDEDRVSRRSVQRHEPRFKPDWSPELLLAGNYIGRLAMIRVTTALAAGGVNNGCAGAEEWELLLRLSVPQR